MHAVVWVDAWQMECCGEAFAVGDDVTWQLDDDPDRDWLEAALGPQVAARVTHAEEHHPDGEDLPQVTGRVVAIARSWCDYRPDSDDGRLLLPVPGSAVLSAVDRYDGGIERAARPGLTFNGWVVDLQLDGVDRA
ncbi:DUF6578 domain-containing protein [Aeromicrobium massiliense]|uniref:DUF6578 domain-containing protein n=1 Tax=Aeromicrobium massiliense TaxID=1464554 RepID=UPI000A4789DA|nr:DUF6578 domain-containing protein [Aeromicrobium massiliense]